MITVEEYIKKHGCKVSDSILSLLWASSRSRTAFACALDNPASVLREYPFLDTRALEVNLAISPIIIGKITRFK